MSLYLRLTSLRDSLWLYRCEVILGVITCDKADRRLVIVGFCQMIDCNKENISMRASSRNNTTISFDVRWIIALRDSIYHYHSTGYMIVVHGNIAWQGHRIKTLESLYRTEVHTKTYSLITKQMTIPQIHPRVSSTCFQRTQWRYRYRPFHVWVPALCCSIQSRMTLEDLWQISAHLSSS